MFVIGIAGWMRRVGTVIDRIVATGSGGLVSSAFRRVLGGLRFADPPYIGYWGGRVSGRRRAAIHRTASPSLWGEAALRSRLTPAPSANGGRLGTCGLLALLVSCSLLLVARVARSGGSCPRFRRFTAPGWRRCSASWSNRADQPRRSTSTKYPRRRAPPTRPALRQGSERWSRRWR